MTETRVMRRVGWAMTLWLPGAAGCPTAPSVWLERNDTLEVAGEGATRLVSVTQNGHQTLTGTAQGNKVAVQAHVRAGGNSTEDAQAALDAVQVFAERAGDAVKVGWKWKVDEPDRWGADVDFTIDLPEGLATDITTHNGAVTARGLAGPSRLTTHNGKIVAETTGPELKAATHNGEIEATSSAAAVILENHNGSISARLTAEGDVGGTISTHNGGIAVTFGENAAAALECSVSNGTIHCARQLEQSRVKPDRLTGSIKGGKQTLKIETHNGSIKIE